MSASPYRQLHSRLTLYYWVYNAERVLFLRGSMRRESDTVFLALEEEENERISSRFLVERISLCFSIVSRLASDATPLGRVFNRENPPTVLIRINFKNSHFANFLHSPLSLVQRYRSKNRENRKWGDTRDCVRIIGKSKYRV